MHEIAVPWRQLGDAICFKCPFISVVWLKDGRGACGYHSEELSRLPPSKLPPLK